MKTTFFFLLLALVSHSAFAQVTEAAMTNTKVVELYNKGLGASVIVNKIKTSKTNFNTSTDTLIALKEKKLPDDIINAMIEVSANKEQAGAVVNLHDPAAPHESGIYYFGDSLMKEISPTVASSSKSGSGIGAYMTYGLASTNQKATVDGATSRNALTDTMPVFYFYFDKNTDGLNKTGWFSSTSNPNEFILLKMKSTKSHREFITGSSNAYLGSSSGVNDKNKVAFDFVKVRPGVYRVVPKAKLKPGEYGFTYAGNATSGGLANKIYDFSIR